MKSALFYSLDKIFSSPFFLWRTLKTKERNESMRAQRTHHVIERLEFVSSTSSSAAEAAAAASVAESILKRTIYTHTRIHKRKWNGQHYGEKKKANEWKEIWRNKKLQQMSSNKKSQHVKTNLFGCVYLFVANIEVCVHNSDGWKYSAQPKWKSHFNKVWSSLAHITLKPRMLLLLLVVVVLLRFTREFIFLFLLENISR